MFPKSRKPLCKPQNSVCCNASRTICLSTNVAAVPQPNGHVSCELLSIDNYNASENFVRSFTSHHYSIMVSLKGNNRLLAHGIGKRDREMRK